MTFSNITGEPKDEWIGSGIAETVTSDLKKVRGLSVIGRERTFEVLKDLGTGQLENSTRRSRSTSAEGWPRRGYSAAATSASAR